jgi:dihydrodipicolinate synthase/N-acetylneuraminate lyase
MLNSLEGIVVTNVTPFTPSLANFAPRETVELVEACMLGVIPNTLVRPPSLQISDTERAKLREAMIASELLVPKSKTLFQV